MCDKPRLLLAPLRGVTIRCFREVFASAIVEAGFVEAVMPFISANAGVDPLKDRELKGKPGPIVVTPQFIGKDPVALRDCLERIKSAGYRTADLNAGCPYPMVRNKGRGSGLLRTPKVLEQMISVGCETMGPGNFSVKTRLGMDGNGELELLMPVFNAYPLRFLTVHARNARQMYEGACDWDAYEKVAKLSKIPLVPNGDLPLSMGTVPSLSMGTVPSFPMGTVPLGTGTVPSKIAGTVPEYAMVGRSFIRSLGEREDIGELLRNYIAASSEELFGDRPVLGRMKELLAYWKDQPHWHRRWSVLKIARTVDELLTLI